MDGAGKVLSRGTSAVSGQVKSTQPPVGSAGRVSTFVHPRQPPPGRVAVGSHMGRTYRAEGEGVEPPRPRSPPVFETGYRTHGSPSERIPGRNLHAPLSCEAHDRLRCFFKSSVALRRPRAPFSPSIVRFGRLGSSRSRSP